MNDEDLERAGDTRQALRQAVADAASKIEALTPGRSGNASAREGDTVAITPTGVPYPEIGPADIPVLDVEGTRIEGDLEPSSEVPMHLGIYDTMDVGAIVHAHSPWATTLAVLGEPLPPVHYSIAHAGREVPVAAYEPFGTRALAEEAVRAMTEADSTACILANHGLVAAGSDIADAFETAEAVEAVARVYLQARSVGDPVELDAEALTDVEARFQSYGQQSDG